jgi:hypothetical protein
MSVPTDLKNRGSRDVFFVICDGPRGLPEVAGNAWPQAIVQTGALHHADLPITPVWRSGGGSCWRRARSSREGRPKPVAVTHAALSGLEEQAGIRLLRGPP